jgi:hypothetical protein
MVSKLGPKDGDIKIKFGGGLHTRASEDEIGEREAADGANFLLDLENTELRPRPPFDLIGTIPNGAEIRGGGSLLKSDGTVSTIIQAGANVYSWDGTSNFTLIGTAAATAQLRGHWRSHNWTLDDKLLLTDMNLVEVVKEWDGTTFQSVSFTNGTVGASGAAFGTFYAKYLSISNERAIFSHVRDPSVTIPHMIVGSERGDYETISSAQRPASSLSEADPFFLLSPDLKPINGHVEAFGTTIISTERGQLFNLTGASAKDFAFDDFYPGSFASGEEAVSYIGNDIIYGRQGRIESVRDTDRFGDTEADDLTRGIADKVMGYTGWRIVYNSRLNRTYLFPDDVSEVWVLNNAIRDEGKISPWMKWTTNHSLAFQPTFVMSMLDPLDGLEYVFMGDGSGNFYRMEGSGAGDAGSVEIAVTLLTRLYSMPLDAEANSMEGYIKYHKNNATDVRMTFEYSGMTAFDESVEVTLPAISGVAYFGGDFWFGGEVYFGAPFANRPIRQKFDVPGQASDFQLRMTTEGTEDFRINEVGLRFKMASQ